MQMAAAHLGFSSVVRSDWKLMPALTIPVPGGSFCKEALANHEVFVAIRKIPRSCQQATRKIPVHQARRDRLAASMVVVETHLTISHLHSERMQLDVDHQPPLARMPAVDKLKQAPRHQQASPCVVSTIERNHTACEVLY